MASSNLLIRAVNRISLVQQIVIGLTLGIALAVLAPQAGIAAGLLGSLFVGALKAGCAPHLKRIQLKDRRSSLSTVSGSPSSSATRGASARAVSVQSAMARSIAAAKASGP